MAEPDPPIDSVWFYELDYMEKDLAWEHVTMNQSEWAVQTGFSNNSWHP